MKTSELNWIKSHRTNKKIHFQFKHFFRSRKSKENDDNENSYRYFMLVFHFQKIVYFNLEKSLSVQTHSMPTIAIVLQVKWASISVAVMEKEAHAIMIVIWCFMGYLLSDRLTVNVPPKQKYHFNQNFKRKSTWNRNSTWKWIRSTWISK